MGSVPRTRTCPASSCFVPISRPRLARRCGATVSSPPINQGTYISNKFRPSAAGRMPPMRHAAERQETAKKNTKKVVIEKSFDPKKILNFVNNPKFSLVEQRRELDLLEKMEKIRAEDAGSRSAGGSRHQLDGDGIPDADRSARSLRYPQGIAGHARYVRARRGGARRPDGRAARRKRRSHGAALLLEGRSLGRARRHHGAQGQRQEFRSGFRRGDQGPEAARSLERHAGGLRFRIRPHAGARSRRRRRR